MVLHKAIQNTFNRGIILMDYVLKDLGKQKWEACKVTIRC